MKFRDAVIRCLYKEKEYKRDDCIGIRKISDNQFEFFNPETKKRLKIQKIQEEDLEEKWEKIK